LATLRLDFYTWPSRLGARRSLRCQRPVIAGCSDTHVYDSDPGAKIFWGRGRC